MINLQKNEQELTNSVMSKISLSKDKENLEGHVVSLSKCVVDLSKKADVDLGATRARVVVVLDYSGSMGSLYRDGTVQNTLNRLVPLGLTFDDNGEIDVYLFQNDYKKMNDMNLSNYENYIQNVVNKSGYRMGGTCYAPVLRAIISGDTKKKGLFGLGSKREESLVDNSQPTFILFITDGDNSDKLDTDDIVIKSSDMNVFIQFIGIGTDRFDYLRKLDDLEGRRVDNTGFSAMRSLQDATDMELYNNILEQFVEWLKITQ
ncbi:MAG: VWA domain-containing protein [Lachnospiraceae bacterium]|nr:VWA domain-containing protein [Lachnospiraceae bacterium]